MKKFFLWVLMVLVFIALILGGTGYYFYRSVDAADVEQPALPVMGQPAACTGGDMQVPVLNGVFYKRVAWAADTAAQELSSTSAKVEITAPDGAADTHITVKKYAETVFDGTLSDYASFGFAENGSYDYTVTAQFTKADADERPRAYGTLTYEFRVKVEVQMTAEISAERVKQGQLLAVRVTGNLDDTMPTAESELGALHFVKVAGNYTAYLAIPYNQETGEYTVTVNCKNLSQTLKVIVDYVPYEKLSVASAAELPDAGYDESAAAVEEYRSAVWPLYDNIQPESLWDGKFIVPVTGTIACDYGVGTLLPGQTISTRHSGVDYVTNSLSAVVAPNAGRVVFAGTLKLTGKTIIIEHGGGIKSFLFYLDELSVQTGDTVTKGQTVGTIGTVTTGGRLHFEIRVGNKSVNPSGLTSSENALGW